MQKTRVRSLGWEDPLEKGMAIHSTILAWRLPWAQETGGLQSVGSQRVGHDWATNTTQNIYPEATEAHISSVKPSFFSYISERLEILAIMGPWSLVQTVNEHTGMIHSTEHYASFPHWMGFPFGSAGKESACNVGDWVLFPGSGRSAGEGIGFPFQYSWASLVAQLVKNLPAMLETWMRSLGWEIPRRSSKATHSRILDWRIPWTV